MRKLTFLIISLLVLAGWAYALTLSLFPDTPLFPRIPTGDGTIGGAIAKILGISDLGNYPGDGTVQNSLTLSGVSGTGYLKKNDCTSGTEKWTGIDADGKAICGSSTFILADYGTISEQWCDATIYHASGSTSTSSTGMILKAWDIVETPPICGGLTIAFSDLSILRLDADTTVSLDVFTMPSDPTRTIASAIMSNGSLWWRILTETGAYSIGTDKIVAWVRGTSISITSTGNIIGTFHFETNTGWLFPVTTSAINQTNLTVLDSTNNTIEKPAATLFCRNLGGIPRILPSIGIEKWLSFPNTGCAVLPTPSTEEPKTLYTVSSWIRQNTYKDIGYMGRLIDMSIYPSPVMPGTPKQTKILDELISTLPTSPEVTGLIPGTSPDETSENIDITTPINPNALIYMKLQQAVKKSKQVNCRGENKSFWDMGVSPTSRHGWCEEKNVIAVADYTAMGNDQNLYFVKGKKSLPLMDQTWQTNINLWDDGNLWNRTKSWLLWYSIPDGATNFPFSGAYINTLSQYKNLSPDTDLTNIMDRTYFWSWYTMVYVPSAWSGSCHGSAILGICINNDEWKNAYYSSLTWLKPQASTPIFNQGIEITQPWQYLSYPSALMPSLAGKTVTIELVSPIPISPPTTKHFVLDFWAPLQVSKKWTTWTCWWWICPSNIESPDFKTITIALPLPPLATQMIIGNTSVLVWWQPYQLPIWTTIKKISISN